MVHGAAAHACVPSSLRSRCYFGRLRSIASATERGVGKRHYGVQARGGSCSSNESYRSDCEN